MNQHPYRTEPTPTKPTDNIVKRVGFIVGMVSPLALMVETIIHIHFANNPQGIDLMAFTLALSSITYLVLGVLSCIVVDVVDKAWTERHKRLHCLAVAWGPFVLFGIGLIFSYRWLRRGVSWVVYGY